jgi:hypothetical protein
MNRVTGRLFTISGMTVARVSNGKMAEGYVR